MFGGDKKKDKRDYEKIKEEWIEMQDLNAPENQNLSKKIALEQIKVNNQRLQQQNRKEEPKEVRKSDANVPFAIGSNISDKQNKSNVYPQMKPKQKRAKIPPSLPMIEVKCDFCTVVQLLPGNVQVYICGSCENMNQCYPLYGIMICGCCQAKVGFGFGTAQYVKCPKCTTLSRVPLEPMKNYETEGLQEKARKTTQLQHEKLEKIKQEEKQKQKQKQEQKYEVFFFDEENLRGEKVEQKRIEQREAVQPKNDFNFQEERERRQTELQKKQDFFD